MASKSSNDSVHDSSLGLKPPVLAIDSEHTRAISLTSRSGPVEPEPRPVPSWQKSLPLNLDSYPHPKLATRQSLLTSVINFYSSADFDNWEKLWQVETYGLDNPDSDQVAQDRDALELMSRYTERQPDGTYTVPLLWKSHRPDLRSNMFLVYKLLQNK